MTKSERRWAETESMPVGFPEVDEVTRWYYDKYLSGEKFIKRCSCGSKSTYIIPTESNLRYKDSFCVTLTLFRPGVGMGDSVATYVGNGEYLFIKKQGEKRYSPAENLRGHGPVPGWVELQAKHVAKKFPDYPVRCSSCGGVLMGISEFIEFVDWNTKGGHEDEKPV